MQYQDMTKKEMQREYHRLCQRYQEYEQQGLQLDLSRGKPAPEQLALSQRMQSRGCRSRTASSFAPCRVMTAILP